MGELPLGTKTATWQITGVSEGFDSLIIRASGANKQHLSLTFLFSDSYSPSPSITVGDPSPTSPPTATPTPTTEPSPTPTPSQAPTNTPTPNPNTEPTPPPTEPLSIVLKSPTTGERWVAGTVHTIKWSTSGGTKPLAITLDYSLANTNGPWTTIAADIADNGSLTWKTPNSTTTVYLRALATDSSDPTQSALIMRNVELNESGAPTVIIVPVALMMVAGLVLVVMKLKKKKA